MGWYSTTPQAAAIQIAEILKRDWCDGRRAVVLDAFCGCGGNTIQFARLGFIVIAVDNNAERLRMARNNCDVYGVTHAVEFVLADSLQLMRSPHLRVDAIFLSPPWGGPGYAKFKQYDLRKLQVPPMNGLELLQLARQRAPAVVYYLPRNTDPEQIADACYVEKCMCRKWCCALAAFYAGVRPG